MAGIVVMDAAGVIVEFDPGAERLLGYCRADAVGARVGDLIVPERMRAAHEAGLARHRGAAAAPLLGTAFDMPARCADGGEIRVRLTVERTGEEYTATLSAIVEPTPVPGELHLDAERYRTLFERLPIMLSIVEDGTRTWTSPASESMFAARAGQTLLANIDERTHPGDRDAARAGLHRALDGGVTGPVEMRVRDKDGSWRVVSIVTHNLLAEPAIHGMAFYATDVTRAKEAEDRYRIEAARLGALIEALNVGVLLQDQDEHVVLANAAFVEMFSLGLSAERLRGSAPSPGGAAFGHAYADRDSADAQAADSVKRARPVRGDEVVLGNGRILRRDYLPIMLEGATLGHLWVFHDVTEQAEERRGLEARNRVLTELSALKTEFVRVASHELRTPLTSISTFANLLGDPPDGDPDRAAALDAVRRNADRMLLLVADLLLLAKLESGEIVLAAETVDVPRLLHEVCDRIGPPVAVPEGPDGPPIVGDRPLLHELFATAVGVAAAAADTGDSVAVTAVPDRGGWTIRVVVPTTDPATAERLLSTRLPHPNASGEYRTGALALMLARGIAARHGGVLTTRVGGDSGPPGGRDDMGVVVTIRLQAAAPR